MMEITGLNLLIPDKPDEEHEALAESFAHRGRMVHRIAVFGIHRFSIQ